MTSSSPSLAPTPRKFNPSAPGPGEAVGAGRERQENQTSGSP